MKRTLLLLLTTSFCTNAFAHAALFDNYLQMMVNFVALLCVITIAHLSLFLITKVCKNTSVILKYKAWLNGIVEKISCNKLTTLISAWILSSMTIGIYLSLIAGLIFLLGGILIQLVWILYTIWVLEEEKRYKYFMGPKALCAYLNCFIMQIVGMITYMIICNFDFFKQKFHVIDSESELLGMEGFYPSYTAPFEMLFLLVVIAFLFATPYILLAIKNRKVVIRFTKLFVKRNFR